MPAEARGVGYLLAECGAPARLRSYHLDDATLLSIADRAAELRRSKTGGRSGWETAA